MSFGEESGEEQGKQNFKYNAKELDKEHGLNQYDYAARFMDPSMIRFTTVDPMAEKRYWQSPYIYCSNNPMNRIDPDGMLDISKLIRNTHYGVIAVFPELRDRKLEDDYKAANGAGIATIQVANIREFADGMSKMVGLGITTDNYTLNSHGGQGFFYIGDPIGSNKVTNQPINDFQDLGVLKKGLSGKNVFIGSCNVTQDANDRGISTIKRFSKESNATVISSDHLLTTKFEYDGSDYLSKPYSDIQMELQPELKTRVTNSYHLVSPGENPIQIYNFTIDKNGKFSWDTENKK